LLLLAATDNRLRAQLPWADHQHAGLLDHRQQLIGRADRCRHHFGQTHQRCADVLGAGCQRDHAGTGAQGALGGEQCCTASTVVTADSQHSAEHALVRRQRARAWPCQIGWHQAARGTVCPGDDRRVCLQVVEYQVAYIIRRLPGEQAEFQTNEADRQLRAYGMPEYHASVGTQPGRNIHRCHGQAGGVDRFDRLCVGFAHLAG
jgi:hypothetical protein